MQVNQAMRQRRERSSQGDLPGTEHRETAVQETESRVSMKDSPRKGVSLLQIGKAEERTALGRFKTFVLEVMAVS